MPALGIQGDISAWVGQFTTVPDARRIIWPRGHWSQLHQYMFYSLIASTVNDFVGKLLIGWVPKNWHNKITVKLN